MLPRRCRLGSRFRALTVAAVTWALAGCGTAGFGSAPATSASGSIDSIDRVVLGSRDLESGMQQCAQLTGVEPVAGGVYPDLGVADGLISLGTHTFLEVLAPDPSGRATALPFQPLHSYDRLTPFAWTVQVADLEGLRARLQAQGVRTSAPERGRRDLPDRTRLEWRSVRILDPADPLLPTFIEWDAGASHPAGNSPSGCRLQALLLETPRPDALRATLQLLDIAVEVVDAPRPRLVVRLSCTGRDVEIR